MQINKGEFYESPSEGLFDYIFYSYNIWNIFHFAIYLVREQIYSKKEFENKYLFKPTKAAITLYKALYGDKSDNIEGSIYMDKTKLVNNIKELCYNYIKVVADENKTIADVEADLKKGNNYGYICLFGFNICVFCYYCAFVGI